MKSACRDKDGGTHHFGRSLRSCKFRDGIHHHACDCREAYVRKLEKVVRAASDYCLCESGEEYESLRRMQKALKALGEL